MSPFSGIAAIHKPAGLTSFQALFPLKRKVAQDSPHPPKVGHAGTLDRFATGLLVALVGSSSHLAPVFTALDKRYRAVVRFGVETATLDPEGEVVATAAPPSLAAIEAAMPAFRGPILQAPPAYSALHVDGKRAYERALAGEAVDMKPRPVTIHALDLVSFDGRDAVLEVRCSSGTYIRSLARDLALAAGSRAHLVALERSSIGPVLLENAVMPDDFDPSRDLFRLDPRLAGACGLAVMTVPPRLERAFLNGGQLRARDLSALPDAQGVSCGAAEALACFAEDGAFLGLVERAGERLRYRFVVGDPR